MVDGDAGRRGAVAAAAPGAGRRPRPTPTVRIPAGTKPAEVPLDPALAIRARFGELAS